MIFFATDVHTTDRFRFKTVILIKRNGTGISEKIIKMLKSVSILKKEMSK